MPGDQDRRPFGSGGQKGLKACRSIAHSQNLPEADSGAESDLPASARDELVIRHLSDCCEVFNPIEPEREVAAANADRELTNLAVSRGIGQVAAICIQSRSPDDLPALISRLLQTCVYFVDHLLLGSGPVLIDISERTEGHRKLDCRVIA